MSHRPILCDVGEGRLPPGGGNAAQESTSTTHYQETRAAPHLLLYPFRRRFRRQVGEGVMCISKSFSFRFFRERERDPTRPPPILYPPPQPHSTRPSRCPLTAPLSSGRRRTRCGGPAAAALGGAEAALGGRRCVVNAMHVRADHVVSSYSDAVSLFVVGAPLRPLTQLLHHSAGPSPP